MGKTLQEFKNFLMQGNLITLAIAFVMGGAFAALLNSFVGDLITPLIGAILGKTDFSGLTFTVHKSLFHYGSFISALITFVSIAAAVFFFIVKPYEAVTARGKKPEADAGPSDEERRHQELLAALAQR
jgi:large conductance mechanosensitive channel